MKKVFRFLLILIILAAAGWFLYLSLLIVPANEVTLVQTVFPAKIYIYDKPGYYLNPFIVYSRNCSVKKFSRKSHAFDFPFQKDIAVLDKQFPFIKYLVAVEYKLDFKEYTALFEQFTAEKDIELFLQDTITGLIREKISDHLKGTQDLSSFTGLLTAELLSDLQKQKLHPAVMISNIVLQDEFIMPKVNYDKLLSLTKLKLDLEYELQKDLVGLDMERVKKIRQAENEVARLTVLADFIKANPVILRYLLIEKTAGNNNVIVLPDHDFDFTSSIEEKVIKKQWKIKMKKLIKRHLENIVCDFAEIQLEERLVSVLAMSNGQIENISKNEIISGNVRVLKNKQWGFVSFNALDKLDDYIRQALQNARAIADYSVYKRKVLSSPAVTDDFSTTFQIDPFSVSTEEKIKLLRDYDNILVPFKKIASRKCSYLERREKKYYGNTEGSLVSQNKVFTGISAAAFARDGHNVQVGRDSWGRYAGYEEVSGHEKEVENIGRIAESLLTAGLLEGGRYDVILNPRLAGVFAHEAFGHLSEADFVFENKDMMKIMTLGRKFGIPELNIIDDGSLPGQAGSLFIDEEGVRPIKNYLIKDGILNSRLHSRETAYQLKEPLTGNARAINPKYPPIVRMTNTYIENGKFSFNDILNSLEDGIYALDYIGGQTNLEMFTFSSGYAYRVKNGQIKEMLKNVVLTGNVFDTLFNIEMIGNDLVLFGGLGGCGKGGQSPLPVADGGPHIKIKNVLIGGV